MRIFLSLIIIIFSLQSWTNANDISEFEIEGIGIGDSLLNFLTEDEIIKNSSDTQYYKDNKYSTFMLDDPPTPAQGIHTH